MNYKAGCASRDRMPLGSRRKGISINPIRDQCVCRAFTLISVLSFASFCDIYRQPLHSTVAATSPLSHLIQSDTVRFHLGAWNIHDACPCCSYLGIWF